MDKIIDDNNKIVGNINLDNSNIKFIGKNNILYVDNGFTLVNSSIEFRGDNSLVYLCKTNDKLTIDVKIYNNSTLYFGKNMWINKGIKIVISEETNVFFGCDCLVSYDTCIRTGDPHIIYDINTRKRVNHSKSVYIGDHVWIGQHVMILKNTMIGSGSVIGAMSLVTNKKYSSNSVYAGTPAKKVRSDIYFSKDDLLKFSDIKNKTFIWPTDIISVDGKVYGYIMPYKRAKNLNASNPLMVNLNSLEKGILRAEKDIKLLTDNGVHICDLRYNTLYNNGNIYVIDTIEYDYKLSTYKENREGLDKELMLFLIDNYFDDFVFSNSVLREMYLEFEVRGIDFMREFRKMISEYIGEDVVYLNKAKSLVKKNNNPVYYREFLGGSIYE